MNEIFAEWIQTLPLQILFGVAGGSIIMMPTLVFQMVRKYAAGEGIDKIDVLIVFSLLCVDVYAFLTIAEVTK